MTIRRPTIVCFAVAMLSNPTTRAGEDDAASRTITVSGTGKITTVPYLAVIEASVITQAKSAQGVMAADAEAMSTLRSLLKERGVANTDSQTTDLEIGPRYRSLGFGTETSQNTNQLIVGFQVENTFRVTVRQFGKLGTLLDTLVGSGADQIHSLSIGIDKPERLLDEVRRLAIADAKHTAELLAGEADVVIGPPVKIKVAAQNLPSHQHLTFPEPGGERVFFQNDHSGQTGTERLGPGGLFDKTGEIAWL